MNTASASITDKPTALSRLRTVNPRLKPWVTPPDSNGFIDAAHRINAPMRSLHKTDDAEDITSLATEITKHTDK